MSSKYNADCHNGQDSGLHEWTDLFGNHGTELRCQHHTKVRVQCINGLFAEGSEKEHHGPASYFESPGEVQLKRRVLVVVDDHLPESLKSQIQNYFGRCQLQNLLEAYTIRPFARNPTEQVLGGTRSVENALKIVSMAKEVGIRRRDLLIGIGSFIVTEVVGFAAALYRRATPYISIPTDMPGIVAGHDVHRKVAVDHVDQHGRVFEELLALSHPPVACFFDFSWLESWASPRSLNDREFPQSPDACKAVSFDASRSSHEFLSQRQSAKEVAHELAISEDVKYHVANVNGLFNKTNFTLLQNYCADHTAGRRTRILVVMDDYRGNTMSEVNAYFEYHAAAIDRFSIFPLHITSNCKTIDNVLKIVNAAVGLQLSSQDLLIGVGGGTLMDMVGLAAAFYKGGTRYLKIPTTLVGMIDAGVAVKVGVNLGNHKNLIGSYFAPVACLLDLDQRTFLGILPKCQLACGVAEALKMAVIKSPRLFELIAQHGLDFQDCAYVKEFISLSVQTMLEELQPNLREENLKRIVDFGHEFGHIIESLALNEVAHGECVAVGMGIASYIAFLKGIVSRVELDQILDLLLASELPLYLDMHGCCDPAVLWSKISTDALEHKHGLLYLVVPERIGRAGFIEHVSDIDSGMVSESVSALRLHAEIHVRAKVPGLDSGLLRNSSPESDASAVDALLSSPFTPSEQSVSSSSANGVPLKTAAVLGASGDIGSALTAYLVDRDIEVICSVRQTSFQRFKERVGSWRVPRIRIQIGDVCNLTNLRAVIQEADVVYNLAGVVTLAAKPEDYPKILAVNGFAQGIITHLIQQMGRGDHVKVIFPSTQRVHLINGKYSVNRWVKQAAQAFTD